MELISKPASCGSNGCADHKAVLSDPPAFGQAHLHKYVHDFT
jgi:hypothetical protein